jgi:hypothetical protein
MAIDLRVEDGLLYIVRSSDMAGDDPKMDG